jgi:hypothetical protein
VRSAKQIASTRNVIVIDLGHLKQQKMKALFVLLLATCACPFAVASDGIVPILDMDADQVTKLLVRHDIVKRLAPLLPSNDGASLVDFIRWYEAMPPMARYIEANSLQACKGWASAAKLMETKEQIAASTPSAFLQW